MSTLDEVTAAAARHGLVLARAWPRSDDHLLLDLRDAAGRPVAGQWLADEDDAARVAAHTGPPAVRAGRVVLQPGGADRRLRHLAGLVAQPGAVLVAHRPERRAVVRRADGHYVKVVRPGRAEQVAQAARAAGVPGLRVPQVLEVDAGAGTVTTRALPGRTLHELLDRPRALRAATALGRALAALHASSAPAGAARHDAGAEAALLARWEALAARHAGAQAPAGPLPGLGQAAGPLVPVHRDLHDKQVVVDADGAVGLLDFDLAALGEPALDLANLLVHLDLRLEQGRLGEPAAAALAQAVVTAYAPGPQVRGRLAAYQLATARRLVAVYAFRPAHRDAARRVLARTRQRSAA